FSRLARRSLALRPAHSRGHQVVTAIRRLQPFRYLHDCSDCFQLERIAGWALHPLESAAFSRRTPTAVIDIADQRGDLTAYAGTLARLRLERLIVSGQRYPRLLAAGPKMHGRAQP